MLQRNRVDYSDFNEKETVDSEPVDEKRWSSKKTWKEGALLL